MAARLFNQIRVTERDTKLHWGGGFWCKLCGHKFVVGDVAQMIYANSYATAKCCNFFVCQACRSEHGPDDESLIKRASEEYTKAIQLARRWWIKE